GVTEDAALSLAVTLNKRISMGCLSRPHSCVSANPPVINLLIVLHPIPGKSSRCQAFTINARPEAPRRGFQVAIAEHSNGLFQKFDSKSFPAED
ncbi:MAG TPA: hypothetical protein VMX16_00285, partial [Terriglobia bacterium]|nr:hypothetical protein [Terriglobia bacterium]